MNRRGHSNDGFTIVELLIVIVVIGVLATITIIAFNGVQQRALVSSVSSGLSQAKKKLEVYKVQEGAYPAAGSLADAGITDSATLTYQYTSDGTTFCLTGTSKTVSYKVDNVSAPVAGGCAGHGQAGTPAVTNLATNPGFEVNAGWLSNNGSLYPRSVSSTIKRSGNFAVESHNLSSSTSLLSLYGPGANNGNGFSALPDRTYTAAVYVRSDVPHQARIGTSYRVGGVYQTTAYGSFVTGTAGEWTRVSHTSSSPSGTDLVRLIVVVSSLTTQPANTSAWADDLMMVEGSSVPGYADGDSSDWVWNGSPHSSTSTGPAL